MRRGPITFRLEHLSPVFPAGVLLLLLAFLAAGCRVTQASAFDLSGNVVNPFKSAAGKAVVLVFVRTDCPVANRYAPTIQDLSSKYDRRAAFWLVYPSRAESAEDIRKHDEQFGYKIPALRDPLHALVKEGQVQITPEAAVFDTSRKLVYHGRIDDLYVDFVRARSAATTRDLDDAIQAALNGQVLKAGAKPGVGCYISDLE
jgi:thiol-disulfide isomerase/thioredoxin